MKKGKVARIAGFVGALGLSAVLVATAVQGTGAYFQDSQGGNVNTSSGQLQLLIDNGAGYVHGPGTLNLNFDDLMPGTPGTQTISYQVTASSGNVDLWLVFNTTALNVDLPAAAPPSTAMKAGTSYQLFTGGGSGDNAGYGRYGYFKVADSNFGTAFVSGNLKFPTAANDPATNGCSTNSATGRGGSPDVYDGTTVFPNTGSTYPASCGVPSAIKLANGLASGATGIVTVNVGLNGVLQTWQNQPGPSVPYTLVATQAGQAPTV